MTNASEKIDFYKERPAFFRAPRKPELVDLPEAAFLVVEGTGSPDAQAFQNAVGALYSVAYTLKMTSKKSGRDFKVPTFDGAWWIDADGRELPREQWRWELHMMVPDFVDEVAVQEAKDELTRRNKAVEAPLRLERRRPGQCVQILHVGPYAEEAGSIAKVITHLTNP
jgi:hypothetical protein